MARGTVAKEHTTPVPLPTRALLCKLYKSIAAAAEDTVQRLEGPLERVSALSRKAGELQDILDSMQKRSKPSSVFARLHQNAQKLDAFILESLELQGRDESSTLRLLSAERDKLAMAKEDPNDQAVDRAREVKHHTRDRDDLVGSDQLGHPSTSRVDGLSRRPGPLTRSVSGYHNRRQQRLDNPGPDRPTTGTRLPFGRETSTDGWIAAEGTTQQTLQEHLEQAKQVSTDPSTGPLVKAAAVMSIRASIPAPPGFLRSMSKIALEEVESATNTRSQEPVGATEGLNAPPLQALNSWGSCPITREMSRQLEQQISFSRRVLARSTSAKSVGETKEPPSVPLRAGHLGSGTADARQKAEDMNVAEAPIAAGSNDRSNETNQMPMTSQSSAPTTEGMQEPAVADLKSSEEGGPTGEQARGAMAESIPDAVMQETMMTHTPAEAQPRRNVFQGSEGSGKEALAEGQTTDRAVDVNPPALCKQVSSSSAVTASPVTQSGDCTVAVPRPVDAEPRLLGPVQPVPTPPEKPAQVPLGGPEHIPGPPGELRSSRPTISEMVKPFIEPIAPLSSAISKRRLTRSSSGHEILPPPVEEHQLAYPGPVAPTGPVSRPPIPSAPLPPRPVPRVLPAPPLAVGRPKPHIWGRISPDTFKSMMGIVPCDEGAPLANPYQSSLQRRLSGGEEKLVYTNKYFDSWFKNGPQNNSNGSPSLTGVQPVQQAAATLTTELTVVDANPSSSSNGHQQSLALLGSGACPAAQLPGARQGPFTQPPDHSSRENHSLSQITTTTAQQESVKQSAPPNLTTFLASTPKDVKETCSVPQHQPPPEPLPMSNDGGSLCYKTPYASTAPSLSGVSSFVSLTHQGSETEEFLSPRDGLSTAPSSEFSWCPTQRTTTSCRGESERPSWDGAAGGLQGDLPCKSNVLNSSQGEPGKDGHQMGPPFGSPKLARPSSGQSRRRSPAPAPPPSFLLSSRGPSPCSSVGGKAGLTESPVGAQLDAGGVERCQQLSATPNMPLVTEKKTCLRESGVPSSERFFSAQNSLVTEDSDGGTSDGDVSSCQAIRQQLRSTRSPAKHPMSGASSSGPGLPEGSPHLPRTSRSYGGRLVGPTEAGEVPSEQTGVIGNSPQGNQLPWPQTRISSLSTSSSVATAHHIPMSGSSQPSRAQTSNVRTLTAQPQMPVFVAPQTHQPSWPAPSHQPTASNDGASSTAGIFKPHPLVNLGPPAPPAARPPAPPLSPGAFLNGLQGIQHQAHSSGYQNLTSAEFGIPGPYGPPQGCMSHVPMGQQSRPGQTSCYPSVDNHAMSGLNAVPMGQCDPGQLWPGGSLPPDAQAAGGFVRANQGIPGCPPGGSSGFLAPGLSQSIPTPMGLSISASDLVHAHSRLRSVSSADKPPSPTSQPSRPSTGNTPMDEICRIIKSGQYKLRPVNPLGHGNSSAGPRKISPGKRGVYKGAKVPSGSAAASFLSSSHMQAVLQRAQTLRSQMGHDDDDGSSVWSQR